MEQRELLKQIRAKYVGTSDEHEVLRQLVEESNPHADWANEEADRLREQFQERLDGLERREDMCSWIIEGSRIDEAVFWWLSETDIDDVPDVVSSMKGRGLSRDHVEQILGAWDGEVDSE